MRKALCMISGLALLAGLLSGCAETPEVSVVLQKDQEQLIKTANSLEEPNISIAEQVSAPRRVEENFTDSTGQLVISVDAEVRLPEAFASKIIRVTPQKVTQETVDAWTACFFGNQPLYDMDSLTEMTQADGREMLLAMETRLAELEAAGETGGSVGTTAPEDSKPAGEGEEAAEPVAFSAVDELRDSIAYGQEHLAELPETRTPVETTNQLEAPADQNWSMASFAVENETMPGISALFAINSSGYYHIGYWNHQDRDPNGGYPSTYQALKEQAVAQQSLGKLGSNINLGSDGAYQAYLTLPEPKLTAAEAEEQGRAFLAACGLNGFALAEAEQVVVSPSTSYAAGVVTGNYVKGWRLTYARTLDGVQVTPLGLQGAAPEAGQFWSYEQLYLVVGDYGIVDAYLEGEYDIGEPLCENCKLMDFDKIMQIFKKMMPIQYQPHEYEGDLDTVSVQRRYTISQIQFGYVRITETNADYSGLLVPAWIFWGSGANVYGFSDGSTGEECYEVGAPILTINAIDGSVIDLNNGY